MKRFYTFIIVFTISLLTLMNPSQSFAAVELTTGAPQVNAKSTILLDATTGQVLYEYNADVPAPPASMSKMMTEYLVSKAVKEGKLKWDQTLTVGENAAQQIGSRILLSQGDQHTVKELFIAMAVYSANDATVQLAEAVSGTEQNFVKLMNETAKKLSMKNTYFVNATGLDRKDQPEKYRGSSGETMMSARDAALMAHIIIKEEPEFLEIAKIPKVKFRERDKKPMVNWNWMLEANTSNPNLRKFAYKGVDGFKTGHTSQAGNCFTGTALREGTRLIVVVMGVPGGTNDGERFLETAKLFDYGFNHFQKKTILKKNSSIPEGEKIEIKNGKSAKIAAVSPKDFTILVPKGTNADLLKGSFEEIKPIKKQLIAPIKKNVKVATAIYKYIDPTTNKEIKLSLDLVTASEINTASWWRNSLRSFGGFFSNIFQGFANLF